MTRSKPEFHLRRVAEDGSASELEIVTLSGLSTGVNTSRRGFLGTSMAAGALMSMLDGPPAKAADEQFKGRRAKTVYAHKHPVEALVVTPDGKRLISGSGDDTVKFWTLPDGKLTFTGRESKDRVFALAVSPDGKLLATGAGDMKILLRRLPDGAPLRTISGHRMTVKCLAITPDGKTLISGSNDGSLRFWSLPKGELRISVSGAGARIESLALLRKGKRVAAAKENGRIDIFNVGDGALTASLPAHRSGAKTVLAADGDGRTLVSVSQDGILKLWSADTHAVVGDVAKLPPAYAASVSNDGRLLAVGFVDGTVRLWKLPELREAGVLRGDRWPVMSLAMTPDAKLLASGDTEGVILLWDLPEGSRRGFLFDEFASSTDAFVYDVKDKATGRTITFTLPCGSPIPPGARCVCNCVAGRYGTAPVAPPTVPTRYVPSRPLYLPTNRTYCACNKICTCIPVYSYR